MLTVQTSDHDAVLESMRRADARLRAEAVESLRKRGVEHPEPHQVQWEMRGLWASRGGR